MTASENLVTQKEKEVELGLTLTIAYNSVEINPLLEELTFSKFLFKNFATEKANNSQIEITATQDILFIQFCVEGSCSIKSSAQTKPISFKQGQYNIIYLPKGESLKVTSTYAELVHIYLSEEFFFQYIPSDYSAPIFNLKSIGKLFHKNLHLSPKLKNILNEIEDCDFSGNLKNLYTKAKVIELISLQLVQYEEEKLIPATLKSVEVEKMIVAKTLIESNLNQPHTISSLARAAGTNEQYLKTNFKLLFGSTVFGYILSCKMEKAKEMLLTGNHRITEIAEIVGYKHATHFTSAFKKFFGYLPQTIKTIKIFFGTYFSIGFELEAMEILMMI